FHPLGDPPPGQPVTKSGAMINDGKYLIPKAQGLVPGKYRVVISSGERKGPRLGAGDPGPKSIFSKERIPPDYNLTTKHRAERKGGGPNKFDYTIPWGAGRERLLFPAACSSPVSPDKGACHAGLPPGFPPHRAAGGDRHHRGAHRPAPARR